MTVPNPDSLLVVTDLHLSVNPGGVETEVVRGLSLQVAAGEAVGIVGESGSGKTLTVSAIARLLPSTVRLTQGAVLFHGEDLVQASPRRIAEIRGREIGMVFQDSQTSLNPVMRIGTQVREPLLLHHMARRRAASASAEDWLRRLGIPDPAGAMRRYPHEFSGGMRQRAMIAMALIGSPSLVIADEPTTALDATIQAQIIDIWNRLNRELGVALILVSHDLGVVSEVCDRLAVMYAGRIVETGPTASLMTNPRHPYTRALLESMPSVATPRQTRLKAIPGEPPSVGALPTGCPFQTRCPSARDICRTSEPDLETIGDAKVACWVAQDIATAGGLPAPKSEAHPEVQAIGGVGSDPGSPGEEILVLDRIAHHYLVPSGWPLVAPAHVHALDDVSLTVRRGEVLGVAGESGSGKSTLARCILRLIDVDQGSITFRGQDVTKSRGEELRQIRKYMQPVFQDPYGSLNPRARVRDIVAEPLRAHGASREASAARVKEVLEFVGLSGAFAGQLPHQLSGGQRQRVGIARAIAINPELIVADEPISALDVSIQAQVINLFRDLRREFRLTLIFISHDLRIVRHLSTHVAVMFLGKIVEYGPSEVVCDDPMHPYTVALLSSVPEMAASSRRQRIVLSGEPPSPISPPSGCRFRTRCPYAQSICAEVVPELTRMPDGRRLACHFPGVAAVPVDQAGRSLAGAATAIQAFAP